MPHFSELRKSNSLYSSWCDTDRKRVLKFECDFSLIQIGHLNSM
jgi:hypothetical protein